MTKVTQTRTEHSRDGLRGSRAPALILLAFYLVVLAWVTLRPVDLQDEPASNFTPLHTIMDELTNAVSLRVGLRQIVGNLLLLVPLGLLLPFVSRAALRTNLAVVLGTTLLIELLQGLVIAGRSFDVDDLLLNFVGGAAALVVTHAWLGRSRKAA